MGRDPGRLRQEIAGRLIECGAIAVGFSRAGPVSAEAHGSFARWVEEGKNGDMEWMRRHIPLRSHTDHVLAGAQTVISVAFSYAPREWRDPALPMIACYAYGEDYHKALRKILRPVVARFKEIYPGEWRICIDSAPVAEKYWAIKTGIGKPGLNTLIVVPGAGSLCFLVEILTTIDCMGESEEDIPTAFFASSDNVVSTPGEEPLSAGKESGKPEEGSYDFCDGCGLCIKKCPGSALDGLGGIDARRCVNYLMIEHKGELTSEQREILQRAGNPAYGCDICQRVCHLNRPVAPTNVKPFLTPRSPHPNA